MSRRAAAPSAGPALVSPHADRLRAAHACQGTSNDCGPYSAAIVLNALLKAELDPAQMARELGRPRWWGPVPRVRRIPGYATFPWGVADALREHGLHAGWRPWASTARLQRGLAAGELLLPIYGGWRKGVPWAHFAVLVAHDPARGWGFVDPQHERGNLVWHRDARFRRTWLTWGNLLVTARAPAASDRAL